MRRNRNIAALADRGRPVFEITIPATARTSLCAHFSQRLVAKYAYRRDALRKSGRKISRKPVAAGVRGRFLSLNIPIRRTNAGDEIGLITTLYWRFFDPPNKCWRRNWLDHYLILALFWKRRRGNNSHAYGGGDKVKECAELLNHGGVFEA